MSPRHFNGSPVNRFFCISFTDRRRTSLNSILFSIGQNHPTITSVELGLDVLSRFSADFEQPYPNEGYHRILRLKPEETNSTYNRSDIAAILQRLENSPAVISTGPRFRASQRGRGGANPTYRGGGNRGQRGGNRLGNSSGYQQASSPRGRGRGDSNAGSNSSLRGRQTSPERGNQNKTADVGQGLAPTSSESQSTSSEIGDDGSAAVKTHSSVEGEK